jgi:2-keto-4-pentenoate hydratase/2-oxohepta-3-ene-1,7-dioic acid hydratase in catechol pathway
VKYATAEIDGERVIGVVEGERFDTLAFDGDMRAFIAAGAPDVRRARSCSLAGVRLCAPIDNPSKVLAVGGNYAEHAAEAGLPVPQKPLIFAKLPSAIIGPGDAIRWEERVTTQVDWEAELAVVIGRRARRVSEDEALGFVFGYTCANDVTARDIQHSESQWIRGKGLDTFCPLGPWIAADVANPNDLRIACTVNGERVQDSRTSNLVFNVQQLIAFMSRMFTLYPGDVILTGTPPGVGAARRPPRFLADGDEVRVEIEGIGALENRCQVERS